MSPTPFIKSDVLMSTEWSSFLPFCYRHVLFNKVSLFYNSRIWKYINIIVTNFFIYFEGNQKSLFTNNTGTLKNVFYTLFFYIVENYTNWKTRSRVLSNYTINKQMRLNIYFSIHQEEKMIRRKHRSNQLFRCYRSCLFFYIKLADIQAMTKHITTFTTEICSENCRNSSCIRR